MVIFFYLLLCVLLFLTIVLQTDPFIEFAFRSNGTMWREKYVEFVNVRCRTVSEKVNSKCELVLLRRLLLCICITVDLASS